MGLDWLGGALGSVVGGLFGMSEADEQQANSKELMELQNKFTRENTEWFNKNKHQWEVFDLRNAGLNPILSASNGSASVMSGPSGAVGARPNLVASAAQLANVASQTKLNEAQADAVRVQAASSAQQAASNEKNVNSMVESRILENDYRIAQTDMTRAGIKEIDQRIINSIIDLNSRVKLNEMTGQAALLSASAHQQQADASSLMAQVAAENGISERVLKDSLTDESKVRLKGELAKLKNFESHHAAGLNPSFVDSFVFRTGELIDSLTPSLITTIGK